MYSPVIMYEIIPKQDVWVGITPLYQLLSLRSPFLKFPHVLTLFMEHKILYDYVILIYSRRSMGNTSALKYEIKT